MFKCAAIFLKNRVLNMSLARKEDNIYKTIEIRSPFDESLIEKLQVNNEPEVMNMLEEAYEAFNDRNNWLEHYERTEILNKLLSLVENESEDFAMLIAKEGGKPLTDAKVEVARAIDGIALAIKELSHVMQGQEVPMGYTKSSVNRKAYSFKEPIGVVVAVSAFNHPLNLIVHQVVPAIATGCPVIVKPASATALTAKRFVELVHKAGLAKQWCQFCLCDNEVATKLITNNKVAFFSFIGSAKVGWSLKSKLSDGTRCALEHGGVAPVIVDKSSDLKKAIPAISKGGFYHAGQVCVSVQKVFVHSDIFESFVKEFKVLAKNIKVGDPTKLETEVGPLISKDEITRVDQWIKEAVKEGAELVIGGNKLSNNTYEPTILVNPSEKSKVSQKEIFGPVVCVYKYSDLNNAINQANSLDYSFQAAVFSEDINVINKCTNQLDATAVMVNDHTAFRVDWMPFGGRKHSGYGLGGIGYTMEDMTQIKMIVINQ